MSAEKKRILVDMILSVVVLVLAVALVVLVILVRVKRPDLRSESNLNDISIIGLKSFNFIQNKTIPEYPYDDLGITGKLILDCYTGTCIHDILHKDYYEVCDYEDDCYYEDEYWTEHRPIIDHNCSEQCYETGNAECNCTEPYQDIGTCKNKTDDRYENGKVCYAYNAIYYWKGKKYSDLKTETYSYLNDAILKDEECPEGTKSCGIIDSNENKLCLRTNLNCPVNYISEDKLSKEYYTVLIGNKTFYYGNDDTTKRKIIVGLVADSDLLLNKDNDKKDIIDDCTISEFLEDNQNLYKDVNLGYDPYKKEDIDSKGKSYLRVFYNEENINLTSSRETRDRLYFNHRLNNRALDSIHDKTKIITILGLIALGFLLLGFVVILSSQCSYYRRGMYGRCGKGYFICVTIIFSGLMITPLIFGFINISKAKDAEDLDPNEDNSTFKTLNLAFIIIGFALVLFLIAYIILVPIQCCFEENIPENNSTAINTMNK